jgi:oxygen-independent coproporphyrinogen III oxidase
MSSFKHLDVDVLKKFNQPGPRYTSYPTAPVFSPDFTAADFKREISETNAEAAPTDLSLYFHFLFRFIFTSLSATRSAIFAAAI